VFEEVGDGEGVVRQGGEAPQSAGDEHPVQERAHDQTHTDPEFAQPGNIDRTGEAEQQPATHVRSPGAQGRDPRAEAAPTEHVIREVGGAAVGDDSKGQHHRQIGGKGGERRQGHVHEGFLERRLRHVCG